MKKVLSLLLCFVLFSSLAMAASRTEKLIEKINKSIDANTMATEKVKEYAKGVLVPQCTNEVFVTAIEKQNAKKLTLTEIRKLDQEWVDAEEELDIHKQLTSNECAKEIKKLIKWNPMIDEAFVMDNQGANVGQNAITSDYWQGDEAKFKNSFNKGKGGVDIGKNKLDKSTDRVLQQISLPVINKKGKVIGAVTYGVITSKL